ncbi:MAG TPA: hypothetical protein VGF55_31190 [Gemmataceae bacterium]|jgi:hypothetical protein
MADPILTPAAKGDWTKLLDRIDESIARALEQVQEQERAFAPAGDTSVTDPQPPSPIDDRLRGLRAHLEAAGRLAEAVEGLLAADEEEARAWVGLAGRARSRLAGPPGGGIS